MADLLSYLIYSLNRDGESAIDSSEAFTGNKKAFQIFYTTETSMLKADTNEHKIT